jgi:hypothetical protein
MESVPTLIFEIGELTEPIYDWQIKRPQEKLRDRGRVLPRFSMIDPKGEK